MSKILMFLVSILGAVSVSPSFGLEYTWPRGGQNKTFALTCSYITASGSNFGDRTYIVDPDKQMVDAYKAKITETLIYWEQEIGTTKINHMSIDRYSGDFHHRWPGGDVASGKCAKAEKKF